MFVPKIGKVSLNDVFPVAELMTGENGTLIFEFIDPATGLVVPEPMQNMLSIGMGWRPRRPLLG